MKIFLKLFFLFQLLNPLAGYSQLKDTLIHKLDSLSRKTDSAGFQLNNIKAKAYNDQTKLSPRSYVSLLGSSSKQAFTKPFHMGKKDWWRLGEFAIITGGVMFVDEPIQKFALKSTTNHPGLEKFSSKITTFGGIGEIVTLASFGAYGYVFKKEKMITTTLLATQAYLTGGAVESVVKFISGRTRPSIYNSTAEAEPKFLGPFSSSKDANGKKLYSSFPSGHTTVVFAAATVFAKEYYDKPIVPIVSYSIATIVGLSRIFENAHWASDVVAGAALGYLSGRLVVNNYHRYAKIRSPKQNSVSFNLQFNDGVIMPGVIYKFK